MSGLVKSVRKAFKKITSSKIIKAVVIAAAVYFAASAAMEYFAAPAAGGATEAAASDAIWTETASGLEQGAGVAETGLSAGDAVVGDAVAAPGAVTETALAQPVTPAMEQAAYDSSIQTGAGSAAGPNGTGIINSAANPGVIDSSMAWMKDNPMATMILGQGAFGAVGSYEAEKQAEKDREAEDRRLLNRGGMGFDSNGNWAGKGPAPSTGGIVSSTAKQVVQGPGQQKTRPVKTSNLATLAQQNLIKRA